MTKLDIPVEGLSPGHLPIRQHGHTLSCPNAKQVQLGMDLDVLELRRHIKVLGEVVLLGGAIGCYKVIILIDLILPLMHFTIVTVNPLVDVPADHRAIKLKVIVMGQLPGLSQCSRYQVGCPDVSC
jgi:hypothetical protein